MKLLPNPKENIFKAVKCIMKKINHPSNTTNKYNKFYY